MQATAVVYVALLVAAGCSAADEAVEADELVEEGSGLEVGAVADDAGAALVRGSRLGAKAAPRSRFPAAVAGYNRYYPGYSPDYYYPRSYYPAYPNNYYPPVVYPTSSYPPVNYPANNYPPVNYPANNYPPVNYPTNNYYPPYNPYEYTPYGSGVNEYSARHERA